jgi:osmoprotectant transport system substrate-binding protein
VRGDVARREKLVTLDDFARWVSAGGGVRLIASAEFIESPAALPTFEQAYGFRLRGEQIVMLAGGNTAACLRAAAEGTSGVNTAMAYSTDGALAALGLVLLEDNRHAEMVYAPCPVLRKDTPGGVDAIAAALNPVFAVLDTVTLQKLNARIAVNGEEPAAVAAEVLRRHPPA